MSWLAHTDVAGATTVLREADDMLRRRPHLGELADDVAALQGQLGTLRAETIGASSPTTAAAAAPAAVHAPVVP